MDIGRSVGPTPRSLEESNPVNAVLPLGGRQCELDQHVMRRKGMC
jgi:hypothetical protein